MHVDLKKILIFGLETRKISVLCSVSTITMQKPSNNINRLLHKYNTSMKQCALKSH